MWARGCRGQLPLAELEKLLWKPFYIDLTPELIPNSESFKKLGPLEEITMIGYPNGLWDHVNNYPIVRRGLTATPCNSKYNGSNEFLIDAACFPGSSGSPIFIFNQGAHLDGNTVVMGGRLLLIGVLYAGHTHTATGEIKVVPIPTVTVPIAVSSIPNNLGICIWSSRITEFEPALRKRDAK